MDNVSNYFEINDVLRSLFGASDSYLSFIGKKVNNVPYEIRYKITHRLPELFGNIVGENYIVKGSVGAGLLTRTPWIAIMNSAITTSTQRGVYIVLLFSSNMSKVYLTLNQGTTVEGKFGARLKKHEVIAKRDEIRNSLSIDAEFSTDNSLLDVADKLYKEAAICYQEWDVNESNVLLLTKMMNLYQCYSMDSINNKTNVEQLRRDFKLEDIIVSLRDAGLLYSPQLVSRFILSLLTKPLVILSGLSGSGKTRLAISFAKWICADEKEQICIVPVGADWTNREFLLGYPNALMPKEYVKPVNGVLDLILNACQNADRPYFLILDEMNLSYVERYFADFLSAMESEEGIPLMKDCNDNTIPSSVKLPRNLFIIGTINVDETTYMFSPKVLDRANVIEFRIMAEDMREFLEKLESVDKDAINNKGENQAASFVELAKTSFDLHSLEGDKTAIISCLQNFFLELKKIHAEFGYRTASDIFRFMALAEKVETELKGDAIVDAVIIQKMLPKLHGSRKKVEPVLKALWQLCIASKNVSSLENAVKLPKEDSLKYPLSAEKIWRMYHIALDNGFTSFAEA